LFAPCFVSQKWGFGVTTVDVLVVFELKFLILLNVDELLEDSVSFFGELGHETSSVRVGSVFGFPLMLRDKGLIVLSF
jgi:hypothetical protein